MTVKDKTRSYGFIIREETYADCPAIVARVLAREAGAESPVNPRGEGEDSFYDAPLRTHGLALNELLLRCYRSSDGKYMHGPFVEYNSLYHIDLRLAARMHATLRKIDKEIAKSRASEPGDVLMAVARAIGATWGAQEVGEGRRNRHGGFYQDDQWHFAALTDVREDFRARIAKIAPAREVA